MNVARVTNKGQVVLPNTVRSGLRLKDGDKILFKQEGDRFYIANASKVAFDEVIKSFEGAAAEAGFQTEDEMQAYMKEIRREVRGY